MGGTGELFASTFELAGERYLLFAHALSGDEPGQYLTQAEREVVGGIVSGLSAAAIATRRRTSLRTVANQLASAYRKLGVGSHRELLARFGGGCAEGWTRPPASSGARATLRGAAIALEAAVQAPERAKAGDGSIWKELVSGRWVLVDRFDHGGMRFLIGRGKTVTAGRRVPLTFRERQVLAYAALGHSNKVIAYELGLTVSTVSTHLTRASRKLGLPVRDALQLARLAGADTDLR